MALDEYYDAQVIHGTLMVAAFSFLLPLGALLSKARNCCLLPAAQNSLIAVHMFCQVIAVILATVSFAYIFIAMPDLEYTMPTQKHGVLGVAVMSCLYFQLLVGIVRPKIDPRRKRRRVWECIHFVSGRAVISLGILNVGIGIYLLVYKQGIDPQYWIACAAASTCSIATASGLLDWWANDRKREQLKNESSNLTQKLIPASVKLGTLGSPPGSPRARPRPLGVGGV